MDKTGLSLEHLEYLISILMPTDSRYFDLESLWELDLAIKMKAIELECRKTLTKANFYQMRNNEKEHILRIHHASKEETDFCLQLVKTYYPKIQLPELYKSAVSGLVLTEDQSSDLVLHDIDNKYRVLDIEYGNCTIRKALLQYGKNELWVIPLMTLGRNEFYIFRRGANWQIWVDERSSNLRDKVDRIFDKYNL